MDVCVCALFPDILQLEIKQASPLTLVLSLKSLIGLQSLEHKLLEHHCTPVFSLLFSLLWLRRLAGGAGRKAPAHLLYRPRETQLQAKSVQNVKHRWPLTHKWVHGKGESPVSDSAEPSSLFSCSQPHLAARLLLVSPSSTLPPLMLSPHTLLSLSLTHHPSLSLSLHPSEALPLSLVASGS